MPAVCVAPPPVNAHGVEAAFVRATGIRAPAVVERLSKGYGHACWFLGTPAGDYLLKLSIRSTSPARFRGEIRAHQLAAEHGLPVPQLVAVCPTPNELGGPFYVQRWIEGEDGAAAWPKMTPGQRAAFGRECGSAVAAMHQVAGAAFEEESAGVKSQPSWAALCADRLGHLVKSNCEAGILPSSTLAAVEGHCRRLISMLPSSITPSLTHRDLYLENTLACGGAFGALIDFEQACFYDPLWDFVKLEAWVFRRYPEFRRPFMEGYRSRISWWPQSDLRLALCKGLEYLDALVYFGVRYPDNAVLSDFRQLTERWLAGPEG